MKEFCDFAYSVWVEDVMAQTLVDRQIAGALKAAGADVTLVDPLEIRTRFDEMLTSPLLVAGVEDDHTRVLRFLGVR